MTLRFPLLPILIGFAGLSSWLNAQAVINLGAASDYAVLAGTSITSTGLTVVNGELGVSPGATITGFAGFGGGGDGIVNGSFHAADVSAGNAQTDMLAAYNLISAETATVTGVTSFANTTVTPGVYNSGASITLTGNIVLSGNGIFMFQMGSTLLTDIGSQVTLAGGALASNVYWQVGTSATLGGSSVLVGTVLANTSITAGAGAVVDGRLLAHSGAITLSGNTITAIPEPATSTLLAGAFIGVVIGFRGWKRRRAVRTSFASV